MGKGKVKPSLSTAAAGGNFRALDGYEGTGLCLREFRPHSRNYLIGQPSIRCVKTAGDWEISKSMGSFNQRNAVDAALGHIPDGTILLLLGLSIAGCSIPTKPSGSEPEPEPEPIVAAPLAESSAKAPCEIELESSSRKKPRSIRKLNACRRCWQRKTRISVVNRSGNRIRQRHCRKPAVKLLRPRSSCDVWPHALPLPRLLPKLKW